MKVLIVSLGLICCLINTAFSQTEKKSFITGGDFNFQLGDLAKSYNQTKQFKLNTGLGYFVAKDLMFGLSFNDQYMKEVNNQVPYTVTVNSIALGPWARYFLKFHQQHALFLEFTYLYGELHYKALENGYGYNFKIFQSQVVPGIGYCFFLNSSVALELLYQVGIVTQTRDIKQPYSNVTVVEDRIIGNLNLGFKIFLHKKPVQSK